MKLSFFRFRENSSTKFELCGFILFHCKSASHCCRWQSHKTRKGGASLCPFVQPAVAAPPPETRDCSSSQGPIYLCTTLRKRLAQKWEKRRSLKALTTCAAVSCRSRSVNNQFITPSSQCPLLGPKLVMCQCKANSCIDSQHVRESSKFSLIFY